MTEFLGRIWVFVRPFQSRLILGLVFGMFFAMSNAALMVSVKLVVNLIFSPAGTLSVADQLKESPAVVRHLVEWLLPGLESLRTPASKTGLALAVLTIPGIMFLRGVFSYLNIYLMSWSALRAVAELRTRLFDHLQGLSLSFFSQARTGDLISRISNDTLILHNIIANAFSAIVKDPLTVLALLALLLSQQPRMTLVSMLIMPGVLVPIIIYGRKVRRSTQTMQTHAADLTSLMHESFTGNRIIKAYNLEARVMQQFRETTRRYIGQMMRVVRSCEVPSQLTEFFGAVGVSLVLLYLVFLAEKPMTPGDFLQFIGSLFLMYQPIKGLSRLYSQLQQARAASQRVFELLDTAPTVVETARPAPLRAAGADIHFEGIDFHYGEKPVLRDIQLTVPSGQLVALVGSSGSGKTTLTNLLLRFYDPQKGAVRIGDTDIRNVSLLDLRNQIAVVTQETILFNDTVRSNIALGRPGAGAEEIEEAAKHAHAHGFIQEKPLGYETVVGEKGAALSGGQRQRLAIARAILKDAPILVLDEATSALDTESERVVQAALEELMRGRTTICIAHRLSTIQKADRIVVLDQGRIVEQGRHEELLRLQGVYHKLHELQFRA